MRVVEDEDADLRQKRKNKMMVIAIIIAVIFIGIVTYNRNNNYYYNSLAATLRAQQQSSGYIVVTGNGGSKDTRTMVELLKIYGFKATVEEGPDNVPPKIDFGNLSIDLPILITLSKRMKIENFHDGVDENTLIVYGIYMDKDVDKARAVLDDKQVLYTYVDLKSEDPSAFGVYARLIASGFDPQKYEGRNLFLEYRGKVYPADEALIIIKKMQ